MRTSSVAPKRKRVDFKIEARAGSEVFLAGTFNNWDPTQNPMRGNPAKGVFTTSILLTSGRHEYKFVVNGEWRVDPSCRESVTNACGTLNSVIVV